MARKRVTTKIKMKDWDDINESLRQIRELQAAIDQAVGEYNEEDAKRRKALDEFCNPRRAEIEKLENGMQDFCEGNRDEFGKKKFRELPNGRVDFRMGTPKVKSNKGFTWKAVLELIKRSRFAELYVRMREDVNKEAIIADYTSQKVTNDDLNEIQVQVQQEETFGYSYNAVEAELAK